MLSLEEVVRYFGDSGQLQEGHEWIRDVFNDARKAVDLDGLASWWWLRSPGYLSNRASNVGRTGFIYVNGSTVTWAAGGIRPALWLNLEH